MTDEDSAALAKRIGRAIARERLRCDLKQSDVAERMRLGNEAVSRIERGIVLPGLERLFQFADVFGCEVSDLLSETSPLAQDRAKHLANLLEPLSAKDRELVTGLVEQLSTRLQTPKTPGAK